MSTGRPVSEALPRHDPGMAQAWGAIPFPLCSTAEYRFSGGTAWAELRIPGGCPEVAEDRNGGDDRIGEANNIHPGNKQDSASGWLWWRQRRYMGRRLNPRPVAGQVEFKALESEWYSPQRGRVDHNIERSAGWVCLAGSDLAFSPAAATIDGSVVTVTSTNVQSRPLFATAGG